MSELERSDHGAITESPTLLPDHGGPQRPPAGREEAAAETPAEPNGSEPSASVSTGAGDRPPLLDENGLPKKRRRRGSRGGRGRKKPGTAGTGTDGAGGGAARTTDAPSAPDASEARPLSGGEDWTDAA